jgi:hypothetical protein
MKRKAKALIQMDLIPKAVPPASLPPARLPLPEAKPQRFTRTIREVRLPYKD